MEAISLYLFSKSIFLIEDNIQNTEHINKQLTTGKDFLKQH